MKVVIRLGAKDGEPTEDTVATKLLGDHIQGEVSHDQTSQDQYDYLDDVGIANDFHPSQGNEYGKQSQSYHTIHKWDARYAGHCQRTEV